MSTSTEPVARPEGIAHVRLTVTDIARSKAFYRQVFGIDPAIDFSDQAEDPEARRDPERLYAGCVFPIGSQLVGLRPAAEPGDRFDSTRVGLDHLSLGVDSVATLEQAADRLTEAGIEHGEVRRLELGMAILSLQDPDDINLELCAPLPGAES